MNRRTFVQNSSLTAAGLGLLPKAILVNTFPSKEKINVGVIGTGFRGQSHVDLLLRRDDVVVSAICDIDERMYTSCLKQFSDRSKAAPKVYTGSPEAYKELLTDTNIDAVIIATPWHWHTAMSIDAMKAGKYVGVEVAGAFSIDECWELVNTAEQTGKHLFFLENVCYRRDVMAVLHMVRQGLFGELIHLEGGYQHDLRGVKFNDGKTAFNSGVEFGEKGYSEAAWRTIHSVHRNGDLYPTHGIGPVANYIDINRGNRFVYLSSMASKARGLHNYIVEHEKGGLDHPNAKVEFKLGDKVTTMIKCNNGETVVLHHDTNLPRPYSLGFRVQGTKGIWMDVNKSLMIDGMTPAHNWTEAEEWLEKYDHPLWKKYESKAEGAGHGGMDWFLVNSFVEHAKRDLRPPIDVYDAAVWMAITPMSEESIAQGGAPVHFPDFTRGKWMHRKPDFALNDQF